MRPSSSSNDDRPKRKGRQPFQPGNRHGKGRPAGSRNNASLALDEIAAGEGENVLRKVLQQALEGDLKAAEILLARIWPPRRGRPVRLKLPATDTAAGVDAALGTVIKAVAAGEVTPEEAGAIATLLETKRRAIETAAAVENEGQQFLPPVFNIQFVSPPSRSELEGIGAAAERPELPGGNVAILETRKVEK